MSFCAYADKLRAKIEYSDLSPDWSELSAYISAMNMVGTVDVFIYIGIYVKNAGVSQPVSEH